MQDYHIHTVFSEDSMLEIDDLLTELIRLEIKNAAITEHVDFDPNDIGFNYLNYDLYSKAIFDLQEKASPNITIAKGVEIGIQSYFKNECTNFLCGKEFDFVIGSVHMVNRMDLHNGTFYIGKTRIEAFQTYLQETLAAVSGFSDFDVLGHLDLVCRYGKYEENIIPYPELADICRDILKKLIETGRGIEVNSSGLRYPGGKPCPAWHIVQHYRELGGEIITIGSDAHKKSHIGYALNEISSELANMGFKYLTCFNSRKPVFVKI